MAYNTIPIENILFLDIETVPCHSGFAELDEDMQKLWDKKSQQFRRDEETADDVYQQAGIYAEFGRVVCISVGFIRIHPETKEKIFYSKSFADDDEKKLLEGFCALVNERYSTPDKYICGHNVKEFDMPFIARRIIINGLSLPRVLDIAGKKPWEVSFIDTMEMWKFGDRKSFTSLNLLTHVFGIPTPKDDIDGSQVANVYYGEHDLARIAVYCEKDILATAQVFLKMRGDELIDQSRNVIHRE
ncbi:MAG: 3'-5' exonuclease [Bacteroidales bacterium]|nr:3'-5' exonuclease [Bacteroidales bacterium]